MFLAILYVCAGLYLLLMMAGVLHRARMQELPGAARVGVFVMGFAFLVLGLLHVLRE